MISVDEAVTRISTAFRTVESEMVPLSAAVGRVLAEKMVARCSQPPEPVSSMDGYAVRASDVRQAGSRLKIVGAAPAGHPFRGTVQMGEAVRIFTGAVVPEGADSIVIQEDTIADGGNVTCNVPAIRSRHIRVEGLDFKRGDVVAEAGRRLTPRDLSLFAAADIPDLPVRRRPRVAFAATGDELSRPGERRRPGGIVASSGYGLSALIEHWGGEPTDLGILPDTIDAISGIANGVGAADLVLTLGGASVGDHDLVQRALGPEGFALDFWKIAMRPGKPLIFGRLKDTPLIGLPGNPVSTLVCAILFVQPAVNAMLGAPSRQHLASAQVSRPLPANDARQDYLRAEMTFRGDEVLVEPFAIQDSSMLGTLAKSNCLIVREPHAPAVPAGGRVRVLLLD